MARNRAGPVLHGGAGGDLPPHGHSSRLSSQCESAADPIDDDLNDASRDEESERHDQGSATGKKVAALMLEYGGPIPLTFDGDYTTYKAFGTDGALFTSSIGITVHSICDPGYPLWDQVPEAHHEIVCCRLMDQFQLNLNNNWITAMLRREYQNRYKKFKNILSSQFKSIGKNRELAKTSLPKHFRDMDRWESFISHYMKDAVQKRAYVNTQNRGKYHYTSYQGQRPLANYQHDRDPTLQQQRSGMDVWKEYHQRNGQFVSQLAATQHGQMEQWMADLTQPADGSGVPTPITPQLELRVMEEVLGYRRDYITGIGPRIPRSRVQSRPSTSQPGSSIPMDEHLRRMHEIEDHMTQQMEDQVRRTQETFRCTYCT